MLGIPLEAKRISNAVAAKPRRVTALLGSVDGCRDIDTQTEVGFADFFQEVFGCDSIVENRRGRCQSVQTGNYGVEIRRPVPLPMRKRIDGSGRTQRAAVPPIAQVHGIVPAGDFEEPAQPGDGVFVIAPPAADGYHHIVVPKAIGISKTVQSVGHSETAST